MYTRIKKNRPEKCDACVTGFVILISLLTSLNSFLDKKEEFTKFLRNKYDK